MKSVPRTTVLVALDNSRAFDTINHDVLIDRLDSQFGVRDAVSRWLRSYLSDRRQFVKLGQHSSDIQSVRLGRSSRVCRKPFAHSLHVTSRGPDQF